MISIDNDQSKLVTGEWAEYEGSRFLVTHMSNLDFQREVQRLQVPYRRRIDQGTLDPKISKDIMCKAMSTKLILNWEKVVDGSGTEVPFTADSCYKCLIANQDLLDYISSFAMTIDNFRQEVTKEMGKP